MNPIPIHTKFRKEVEVWKNLIIFPNHKFEINTGAQKTQYTCIVISACHQFATVFIHHFSLDPCNSTQIQRGGYILFFELSPTTNNIL